jgi:hypothetical protein
MDVKVIVRPMNTVPADQMEYMEGIARRLADLGYDSYEVVMQRMVRPFLSDVNKEWNPNEEGT